MQPLASYWFPNELLEWSPASDSSAPFNISSIPLAGRFIEHGQTLDYDEGVAGITALFSTHPTSGHPAQGFPTVEQYAFPFWAYLDYFVQWGGSAAEGLIIPPVPTWTDAAHRNGVPVLGTVFFPPNVYGGKEEWVRDFLQTDEKGGFPVADKLIEVADHYGFEGWFINQETHGMNRDDADAMRAFLKYFQQQADGQCKIMWYDAMLDDGRVIWQEELNDHNEVFFQEDDERISDIMFLDFGWNAVNLEDTRKKALELGRSPWELYAGIDVQARGYKSFARWEALYGEDGPLQNTSVAIYWATSSFDLSETKQPEEVYATEQKFWNGSKIENPPHPRLTHWEGFTGHIPPRSTIDSYPFVTRFNYGLGRFFNNDGDRASDSAWHNMSNQDLLPHWQWETDTTKVQATIDFEESYHGGSCVRFTALAGNDGQYIPLYKVNLPVSTDTELSIVSEGSMKASSITLTFADGSTASIQIGAADDWSRNTIKLTDHVGKQLTEMGVTIMSGEGTWLLGELALLDDRQVKPARPQATVVFAGNEAYVTIENRPTELWYYDVYQVVGDQRRHLRRWSSAAIYVGGLQEQNGDFGTLEIVPVNQAGVPGPMRKLKLR